MNSATLSVYKAQIMLGQLIGLALILPLCAAFFTATSAGLMDVLALLMLGLLPPAAALCLLLATKRTLASYVALLGMIPNVVLFLLLELPMLQGHSGGQPIDFLVQGVLGLPFLYSAITLARVGVGVRVTAGERDQARRLRTGRGTAVLATDAAQGGQELPALPLL